MGFQVNGVEYVNSNGHFTNGLKTVNNTSIGGSGAVTTGYTSTMGTDFKSIGSYFIGHCFQSFTASGNYAPLSAGTVRTVCEVGATISGSNIWYYTPHTPGTYYEPSGSYSSYSQGQCTNLGVGTWRATCVGYEDPAYLPYSAYQIFVRVS